MPQRKVSAQESLLRVFGGGSNIASLPEEVRNDLEWDVDPVDFDTFVTSRDYLGQFPLSARQRTAALAILGENPKEMFSARDKLPLETTLAWGKGSGKDFLVSVVVAYAIYVFLCLRDPHRYFHQAYEENFDVVNIASNAKQAKDIFFNKLASRLKRPCFQSRMPEGVRIQYNADQIIFPHVNLRLHSKHAENESWEGLNLLFWVMDEASAFRTKSGGDNAKACYDTLYSSADTRFPSFRWIGLIISFPRKQVNDFTLVKYYEAREEMQQAEAEGRHPSMWCDRAATWEVNPQFDPGHPFYKAIGFEVLEDLNVRVPEPYVKQFRRDPIDARTKFMAEPPPQEDGFFDIPDKLHQCVNRSLPTAVSSPTTITRSVMVNGEEQELPYVQLDIASLPPYIEGATYYLHGDPGLKSDAFALALGHSFPEVTWLVDDEGNDYGAKRVVIDFVLTWEPQPKVPVNLKQVDEVIATLCKAYRVAKVTFDRWNSANSIQTLLDMGIFAEDMSFSGAQQLAMYRNLKMLVYNGLLTLPDDQDTLNELLFLRLKGQRIEHDAYGKDRADAVAAVAFSATGQHLTAIQRLVAETLGTRGNAPGSGYDILRNTSLGG